MADLNSTIVRGNLRVTDAMNATSMVLTPASSNSTTAGLQINNGVLKINDYGNTVSIGSLNASYCHFQNSANIPFYFNKTIHVDGTIAVYNSGTQLKSDMLRICTTNTAPATNSGSRIEFSYTDGSSNYLQPVYISYTPNDSYRSPAGLKIMGGTSATPAWLEVEGTIYGNGSGLTNLNGSNISSGTVAFARLPTGTGSSDVAIGDHVHNFLTATGGRIASADITHYYTGDHGHMQLDLSTSAMSTNKPANDGYILSFLWDNSGSYDTQLYVPCKSAYNSGIMQMRFKDNDAWTTWANITAGSVANSLTFNNGGSGAASGTTFNGSAAKTISYNTIGAAAAGHGHAATTYQDTRDTIHSPTDAVGFNGVRIDFKNKSKSSIPSTGTWTAIMTMDGYSDSSGGYPHQLGFSMTDTGDAVPLYHRSAKSSSEWGTWKKILDDGNWSSTITLSSLGAASSGHTHDQLIAGTTSSVTQAPSANYGWLVQSHINTGTAGLFNNTNNANAILTVNRHEGNYNSQLGFSNDGRLYYRSFNGAALDTTTAWNKLAWTSEIPSTYAGSSSAGGAANSVANSLTFSNGGSGDASGTTYNGSAAKTISYNSIGAAPAGNYATYTTTTSCTPSAATGNGFYYIISSTNSTSGADSNPLIQHHTGDPDFRILTTAYSDSWLQQIATDFRTNNIYFRRRENGTWKDWVRLALTGESQPASDVSAWAKAATKPSYTASEVGAATSGHTHTTLNTAFNFNNSDVPSGAANLASAATTHSINFYRNGMLIPYNGEENANDGGMIRCTGSENSCVFEMATWDDSGSGETIKFNYYPTTSQITPAYSISVPKLSGTMAVCGGAWNDGDLFIKKSDASVKLHNGSSFARLHYNGSFWITFDDSSNKFTVETDGKVSATSFYASSDRRLKENIKKLDLNPLEIINSLKLKEFNFKSDDNKGDKHIGLIAQEVKKVLPEKYKNNIVHGKDTLSINEGKLPYITMGAVQLLSKKCDKQQKEIDKLKEENKQLKQTINEINKKLDALLKK